MCHHFVQNNDFNPYQLKNKSTISLLITTIVHTTKTLVSAMKYKIEIHPHKTLNIYLVQEVAPGFGPQVSRIELKFYNMSVPY